MWELFGLEIETSHFKLLNLQVSETVWFGAIGSIGNGEG